MSYFITGCNGLVGAYIARKILRQGGAIQALKRPNSDLSFITDIQHKIHWVEGDIFDIELLNNIIRESDYVIHAAGLVSFAPNMRRQLMQVNVRGTANIVNACLAAPSIKKLCYISSVAALHTAKSHKHINEQTKWEQEGYFSQYALSKYLAEQEIWRGIAEGLSTVIVNPSIVLGVSDWGRSSGQLFKFVWQKNKFYIDSHINYVDGEDLATLVWDLLHHPIEGERFILSAGYITYRDLFTRIAEAFNIAPPSRKASFWSLKMTMYTGRILNIFNKNAVPISSEMYKEVTSNTKFYDNTKICQTLGFQFKPLEQSLADICPQILAVNT